MINLPLWKTLDKADQDILSAAAIEVQNWEWTQAQAEEKSWEDKSKAKGIEIVNLPKEIMDEIIKRDREIEWTYAEELVGKDLVDSIRKAAGM
jgi:TRAP-type C4-dicarboxylate transport system substrate-binding protein